MEESRSRAAAGGAAQEAGLGFVAALFMGEDRIGDVWVRPQPFPRPPSPSPSQSQSQSQSQPQPEQLQRQRQQYQQQQQHNIRVKDDVDNEEEPERRRMRDERARIAFGSEIRVAFLSPASERCPPLSVLHTISPEGVWFKLNHSPDTKSPAQELSRLHRRCITEAKTAVVVIDDGRTEVHMAAVRGGDDGCHFWAFAVPTGLYQTTSAMLNKRCLAMVFDLDETLILANTMRSFDDRMEALRAQIEKHRLAVPDKGIDVHRLAGLTAELKRFQEDRALLKCFAEHDYVVDDNCRMYRAQQELVSSHVYRPVIRIPERNLIFTRINSSVKDTSVLVKLRPGWEELKNYIHAKGRKRFEVFICTMSERDYALEMWRLLDTGGLLIEPEELQRRLLCVKSIPGSQKSLSSMFSQLKFHSKLAMVIDDRPEVWEEKDRALVHWVPPYAPYSAPQAEINCPLPVLCGARNVVCSVRGAFFKEFDELFQGKLSQVSFDTDVSSLPLIPSVVRYLSQASLNPNSVPPKMPAGAPDGIAGPEVKPALYPAQQQPAAGGWIEAEDDEQAPESPSPSPEINVNGSVKQHSNGVGVDSHHRVEPVNGRSESPESNGLKRFAEAARNLLSQASDFIAAFEELGRRCNVLAEFRCELRREFSAEAFIDGKKVGLGVGHSNKEAKSRAAEDALMCLANTSGERVATNTVASKQQRAAPAFNPVGALENMCNVERLKVLYSDRRIKGGEYECEVEVGGRVIGRGSGKDSDSAKQQAAEQALKRLKLDSETGTGSKNKPQKRSSSPPQMIVRQESSKRLKSSGENWRQTSKHRVRTPPRKHSRSRRY